jgi:hypothetical protein
VQSDFQSAADSDRRPVKNKSRYLAGIFSQKHPETPARYRGCVIRRNISLPMMVFDFHLVLIG